MKEEITLMREKELAAILKLSTRQIFNLRKSGALPYIQICGSVRYRPLDVARYIESVTFNAAQK